MPRLTSHGSWISGTRGLSPGAEPQPQDEEHLHSEVFVLLCSSQFCPQKPACCKKSRLSVASTLHVDLDAFASRAFQDRS